MTRGERVRAEVAHRRWTLECIRVCPRRWALRDRQGATQAIGTLQDLGRYLFGDGAPSWHGEPDPMDDPG